MPSLTPKQIALIPDQPTEGEPLVIARSASKERADGSGSWWKEWRLRHLKGAYPVAAVLEVRYYGPGSAKIEGGHDWRMFWADDSFELCVWEMLGDTTFHEAESLAPIHRQGVDLLTARRAARNALNHARESYTTAAGAVGELMDRANAECGAKIGKADPGKHDAIAKRMLAKFSGPVTEAKRLRDELKALEQPAKDALDAADAAIARWFRGGCADAPDAVIPAEPEAPQLVEAP